MLLSYIVSSMETLILFFIWAKKRCISRKAKNTGIMNRIIFIHLR